MKLPYADTALDPVISARTISFHHGVHHKTYVDNLNKLVENDPMASMSLVGIVKAVAGKPGGGLKARIEKPLNWDFAAERFAKAQFRLAPFAPPLRCGRTPGSHLDRHDLRTPRRRPRCPPGRDDREGPTTQA